MKLRNCPRCLNTAVLQDGYCGHCRECTLAPVTGFEVKHSAPALEPLDVMEIKSLCYALLASQVTGGFAAVLWIMAALHMCRAVAQSFKKKLQNDQAQRRRQ